MPLRASAPEFVPAAAPARREIVLPDDLFSEDAHVVEEQVLSDDSEEVRMPDAARCGFTAGLFADGSRFFSYLYVCSIRHAGVLAL